MIQAPKGTKDVLPSEAYKWHYAENIMRSLADAYGFKEVRTPVFEHTELFLRGVGDTTDVVQKEMYTFNDKGDRSITLKPEGTAGVVRAFTEHGLFNSPLPLKTYYFTPVFRYERPQAGRLREHHQFGVEVFGAPSVTLDAELIIFALDILKKLKMNRTLSVNINSIGCPTCRADYDKALRAYFETKKSSLCGTCLDRLERNPMRILDCKCPECKAVAQKAPIITDFLCPECAAHFNSLQELLSLSGVAFKVDPQIVRGLDYYTKTVFEIIYTLPNGESLTVCGGGRYDGLCRQIGETDCAGAGFGMGLERLLLAMEQQGVLPEPDDFYTVFIATLGDNAVKKGFELVHILRDAGIRAELNHTNKTVKAQLKYADKIGAKNVIVIGDDEVASGIYSIKSMTGGESITAKADEIASVLGGKTNE